MTPSFYIALRFLTHRKRSLLLSLSGVVFGVAIFICTQAQTQGFSSYFINSTIGSNGALVVRSRFRPRYDFGKAFRRRCGPTTLFSRGQQSQRGHARKQAIFERRIVFAGASRKRQRPCRI